MFPTRHAMSAAVELISARLGCDRRAPLQSSLARPIRTHFLGRPASSFQALSHTGTMVPPCRDPI